MNRLALGQRATTTRAFNAADVAAYRALTGDAGLAFGRRATGATVPGPLLAGLFSFLLGTRLPGSGTKWLKQSLVFPAPAFAGEALTATVEIVRLRPEKKLVNLRTTCTNSAGDVVCHGEALVLADRE